MSTLKTRLTELASDLFSIETAILVEKNNEQFPSAYCHCQIEGDTVVYIDRDQLTDPEILRSSIQTSVHSRYALVHILTEALK